MRSVRVEWEGPFSIEKVLELDNRNKDYGLYQIYGHHIVYGADSLLYIGETGQTFSQRFNDHAVWLEEEEGVFIRVGRIASEDYNEQVRKDAEALAIYWHSPAYNSLNIEDYNGQPLIVVNSGERGDLCEKLSVAEDSSWVKQKYFLKVCYGKGADSKHVVQSDVFEVIGKRQRIVQRARKKALNNVRREDLKRLFEEQHWQGSTMGRWPGTFREHQDEKGDLATLLVMEAPEDAEITF